MINSDEVRVSYPKGFLTLKGTPSDIIPLDIIPRRWDGTCPRDGDKDTVMRKRAQVRRTSANHARASHIASRPSRYPKRMGVAHIGFKQKI